MSEKPPIHLRRTAGRKHLFTVRILDGVGDYIAHKEHLVGLQAVAQYKKEISESSARRVAYVRIFNEVTGHTRYEGGRPT